MFGEGSLAPAEPAGLRHTPSRGTLKRADTSAGMHSRASPCLDCQVSACHYQYFTRAMDTLARSARAERAPAAERRLTVWPARLGNELFLRKNAQFFGALRAQRLHSKGRRSAAQKLHGYECTHGLLVNDTWLNVVHVLHAYTLVRSVER